MIDIAREIYESLGYTVQYQLNNWSRAVKNVREGNQTAVIGALKGDAEDFIFPDENIGYSSTSLWKNNDSNYEYHQLSDLDDINIGLIQSYSYGDTFDHYVKENNLQNLQYSTGVNALGRNIQRLLLGRVDLLVEDESVMKFHLNKHTVKKKVTFAGKISDEAIFVAFSPKLMHSPLLAKQLSDGVTQLRKSGRLSQILAKYGLSDWQKKEAL